MKLKLDVQDGNTILSVSEFIEPQHIAVLRAGLNKLIQTGRNALILDLSALSADAIRGSDTHDQIKSLSTWAEENGAQLVIVSSMEALGRAGSRAEAVKMLSSPLARLLALETKLKYELTRLESDKARAEESLSGTSQIEGDLMKLRSENSRLRNTMSNLENLIQAQLKFRSGEPFASEALKSRLESLDNVMTSILMQEGVLVSSGR